MRAILVDDEPLLLDILEVRLSEYKDIRILKKYTNPYRALEQIDKDKPEVIFLDAKMKLMMGVDFVEIVRTKIPNVKLVFVTSTPDYAIQAFEMNAIDYLVRPFSDVRLKETVNRLRRTKLIYKPKQKNKKRICLFNSIQFRDCEENKLDVRWRTQKTKELFALLLHNHNKPLSKEILIDQLWPSHEWKSAISLLYNSIYHLRRTFEEIKFDIEIQSAGNTYKLNYNNLEIDLHEWQSKVDALPELNKETYAHHKEVIHLYKGDYLNDLSYSWCENERNQYRSIWLYHIRQVRDYLIRNKNYIEATQLYHYVQEVNPLIEESYCSLMKLYEKLNDESAVNTQYRMLEQVLEEEYGVKSDMKIQTWFKNCKVESDKI